MFLTIGWGGLTALVTVALRVGTCKDHKETQNKPLWMDKFSNIKRDAATSTRASKKSTRRGQASKDRGIIACAEWPKRRRPQALRDMKADGKDVARGPGPGTGQIEPA
jgi:hypothetical protein